MCIGCCENLPTEKEREECRQGWHKMLKEEEQRVLKCNHEEYEYAKQFCKNCGQHWLTIVNVLKNNYGTK